MRNTLFAICICLLAINKVLKQTYTILFFVQKIGTIVKQIIDKAATHQVEGLAGII